MTIKWKLRTLMAEHSIKGVDLVEAMGLTKESISRMRNRNDMPDIGGDRLGALLDALNQRRQTEQEITVGDLIEYAWDGDRPNP